MRIEQAEPDDATAAVAILREAAQWLTEIGRPLWPVSMFDVAPYRRAAQIGELVIGYEHDPVACMLLQSRDETYWPADPPGEALYLHKIAVRRCAAGRGWPGRLVAWAAARARERSAEYLRLDTADREKLISLYCSHGFRLVDTTPYHCGSESIVRLELRLQYEHHEH